MSDTSGEPVAREVGSVVPHPLENIPAREYMRIMSSKPFKITVESDDKTSKEAYIHSGLLASLSPSLDALVNESTKEAREIVTWTMEGPVFEAFMMFAYTGKYDDYVFRASADEETYESECTDASCLTAVFKYIAQSSVHLRLMLFADHHDIRSLYHTAFCRLKAALSPSPFARAGLIELVVMLDSPVHVIRDVMRVAVQDGKSLWGCQGLREALDGRSDLKSEFLNIVMENMGNKAD